MELWIRSQDREVLTKVIDVYKQADTNEIWSYSNRCIKNCLGIYATKERALEVLDNIQRKIEKLYALENCSLEKNSCLEQSLVIHNFNVYQMPKE